MSSPTIHDEPTKDQQVTMSAADLERLLADVARGGGILPPGAYRMDGEVFRDILEPTGRVRINKQTGQREQVSRKVRRPVLLTYDTSPAGLLEAKRKAQRAGLDFWHPKYGWLRYGVKREIDVPENLGAGSELFEMVYTPVEESEDIGATSVTMQGIPMNTENVVDSPSPAQDDGPDPFSDEAIREAAAASSGRRSQRGH